MSKSFATPWAVACQAPLSMGFPRQKYWSGLSFPPPGIFLTKELNPRLLHCRWSLYCWATREAQSSYRNLELLCPEMNSRSLFLKWTSLLELPLLVNNITHQPWITETWGSCLVPLSIFNLDTISKLQLPHLQNNRYSSIYPCRTEVGFKWEGMCKVLAEWLANS